MPCTNEYGQNGPNNLFLRTEDEVVNLFLLTAFLLFMGNAMVIATSSLEFLKGERR